MRKTILALALLSAACGDDSSDDSSNSDESRKADGGGTGGDAGESAALAQARVTSGVNATEQRKDLLVEAVCQLAVRCSMENASTCQQTYEEQWDNLMSNGSSDACKDAELDRLACLSGLSCEATGSECATFDAPTRSLCDSDAGT